MTMTQAEAAAVVASLQKQGGDARQAKHVTLLTMPNGARIGVPHTPSDYRTRKNLRADVLRAGYEWPLDGGTARGKQQADASRDRLKDELPEIPPPLTVSRIQAWRREHGHPEGNSTSIKRALRDLGYSEAPQANPRGGAQKVWTLPEETPAPRRVRFTPDDYHVSLDGGVIISRITAFGKDEGDPLAPGHALHLLEQVLADEPEFRGSKVHEHMLAVIAQAQKIREQRLAAGLPVPEQQPGEGQESAADEHPTVGLPDEPMPPAEYPLPPDAIPQPTVDHAADAESLLAQLVAAEEERDRAREQRDELHRELAQVLNIQDPMALDLGQAWHTVWEQARTIREMEWRTEQDRLTIQRLGHDTTTARRERDKANERFDLAKDQYELLSARFDSLKAERDEFRQQAERLGIDVATRMGDDGWETFHAAPGARLEQLYVAADLMGYDLRVQRKPQDPEPPY